MKKEIIESKGFIFEYGNNAKRESFNIESDNNPHYLTVTFKGHEPFISKTITFNANNDVGVDI